MSRSPETPRRRRVGLRAKVLAVLLVIAAVPLTVSALLIEQIGRVAQNFASNEAARVRPYLERSEDAYRDLIRASKDLYGEIAARMARAPELAEVADPAAAGRALGLLLEREGRVSALAIEREGRIVAERERAAGPAGPERRGVWTEAPIPGADASLRVRFDPPDWQAELASLGEMRRYLRRVERVRGSLPRSYRISFLVLVGGVVVAVTFTGILLSRRLTGRIERLVSGTREVAAGDLGARVDLGGRDELAELAAAFNRMVEDLEQDREQINYLQRVSAWQDVARKLAHEIKNPLTPIQLAVQQCVSAYRGDDERYRRLLADTQEIVGEEIGNLRRLVEAFRDLGRLPPVDPKPLDLATVVGDLETEPELAGCLEIEPPEEPALVEGDRLLLRRLLHNLVENGIQAGGGEAVTVAWAADRGSDRAIVTVDDRGPGIAPAERDRVFEPYITSKEQGTGLGLTIAKKIALEHRGSLQVAREPAPTGGARFVLALPLGQIEPVAGGDEDEPSPV